MIGTKRPLLMKSPLNHENHNGLYGEVEFWLDDEQYFLTKCCLILFPKGLQHCPLRVVRADKPIFFLAFSLSTKYEKLFDKVK